MSFDSHAESIKEIKRKAKASAKVGEEPRRCIQCGRKMNPVEFMMGPVCGLCCRKNHKEAVGKNR